MSSSRCNTKQHINVRKPSKKTSIHFLPLILVMVAEAGGRVQVWVPSLTHSYSGPSCCEANVLITVLYRQFYFMPYFSLHIYIILYYHTWDYLFIFAFTKMFSLKNIYIYFNTTKYYISCFKRCCCAVKLLKHCHY